MTAAGLGQRWAELPSPGVAGTLEAVEVRPDVWLALDYDGFRHLLLRVPDDTRLSVTETHGLTVRLARHRVAGREDAHYIDISSANMDANERFESVAADLIMAVDGAVLPERPALVTEALAQWRWFWGVDPDALSDTDAVGLFGELWFLSQWAGSTPDSVDAWQGSEGARHDFQWPATSVEVKTAAKSGVATHRISPLAQLEDPEQGQLQLLSIRLRRDRLARNSLTTIVATISAELAPHPEALASFRSKLASRGYAPSARRAGDAFRILGEDLYEVRSDFPRLLLGQLGKLPAAVVGVSYQLDMAACAPWLTDVTAGDWRPGSGPGSQSALQP